MASTQAELRTPTSLNEQRLKQLKVAALDLVLLDLQIPIRNGDDVFQAICGDARLAKLPVVTLTSSAMHGDREKALASGFTAYIAKPVARRSCGKK